MPAGSTGIALVRAHHANAAKADLLVAADRRGVVGRGIDRDPVVTPVLDQVTDQAGEGVGADPAAMQRRIEEQIDGRMPVLGLGLLPELDQARDGAVHPDRHPRRLRVVPGEVVGLVVPPASHLGGRDDAAQLVLVASGQRRQH